MSRAALSKMSTNLLQFMNDAPFGPREETLTEILLVEIARSLPGGSKIVKSSVADESRQGHDWAWAIRGPSGRWGHLRVQAKRLYSTGNYSTLRHSNRHGRQIDLLLQGAKAVGAIPVYALYNDDSSPFNGTTVSLSACCLSPLQRKSPSSASYSAMAVTMTDAHWVGHLLNSSSPNSKGHDAVTINYAAFPWECLFCHQGPQHPKSYLRKLIASLNGDRVLGTEGVTDIPPAWVRAIEAKQNPAELEPELQELEDSLSRIDLVELSQGHMDQEVWEDGDLPQSYFPDFYVVTELEG